MHICKLQKKSPNLFETMMQPNLICNNISTLASSNSFKSNLLPLLTPNSSKTTKANTWPNRNKKA